VAHPMLLTDSWVRNPAWVPRPAVRLLAPARWRVTCKPHLGILSQIGLLLQGPPKGDRRAPSVESLQGGIGDCCAMSGLLGRALRNQAAEAGWRVPLKAPPLGDLPIPRYSERLSLLGLAHTSSRSPRRCWYTRADTSAATDTESNRQGAFLAIWDNHRQQPRAARRNESAMTPNRPQPGDDPGRAFPDVMTIEEAAAFL